MGGGGARGIPQELGINVGMISHASFADLRLLGRHGGILPRKKFWILKSSKPAIMLLFYIIFKSLRSHEVDNFGSWGVHGHPVHHLAIGLHGLGLSRHSLWIKIEPSIPFALKYIIMYRCWWESINQTLFHHIPFEC